jgi:thiamine kinase-like enzyme
MLNKRKTYFTVGLLTLGLFTPLQAQSSLDSTALQAILESCSPETRKYSVTSLIGGYSGAYLYKLTTPKMTLVVRQMAAQTSSGDMTRLIELSELAGKSGASPHVCFSSHTQKIIVTDFVNGKPTDILHLSDHNLQQLAVTLKKFHQVGLPSYSSDPVSRFESYLKEIPAYKLPTQFQHVFTFMKQFVTLRNHYQSPGFIHTDLHAMNILNEGDRYWIIDLEDSGAGDIYFDLGQLIKNFLLDDHQKNVFLTSYLETPTPQQIHYIYLNTQLAHALYAAWGIRHGVAAIHSKVQVDELLQHVCDEDCPQFLMDVHSGKLALKTPEAKLKYGLLNLTLFLKEWKSSPIQQGMKALSTTADAYS